MDQIYRGARGPGSGIRLSKSIKGVLVAVVVLNWLLMRLNSGGSEGVVLIVVGKESMNDRSL